MNKRQAKKRRIKQQYLKGIIINPNAKTHRRRRIKIKIDINSMMTTNDIGRNGRIYSKEVLMDLNKSITSYIKNHELEIKGE